VDGGGENFLAGAAFAPNRAVTVLYCFKLICRPTSQSDRATGRVERPSRSIALVQLSRLNEDIRMEALFSEVIA
jgi:hypothetical protein